MRLLDDRLQVLFTTNPGLEDVAADEIVYKLHAHAVEVKEGRGRLTALVPRDRLHMLDTLRSIHSARVVIHKSNICPEVGCLEDAAKLFASDEIITRFVTPYTSFAVRSERVGEHKFSSMDISRVFGDAIIKAVEKLYGLRPPVDLDYPAVVVHVEVINEELTVSIELCGEISKHRRGYRIYDHPAALKPTIAYAMLVLSEARDGDFVVDPMCGGGTIAIEAALLFESSRVACMDINPLHIEGAKLNARAALVANRIEFIVGDARELHQYFSSVDVVVSNPPYGIRMGNPHKVREVYRGFLRSASEVVKKCITIITTEHAFVKRLLLEHGWELVHERVVAHGNLYPHILVARHQ